MPSVAQKFEETRALTQGSVAKSREEFDKEKERLYAQLANWSNELRSEKEHKELLLKKAVEQKAELETIREKNAQTEQMKSKLHEETANKLRGEISDRDQKIKWLKDTLQEREKQHAEERKQADKAESDRISRLQATTPSFQGRSTQSFQTPNRNNGTVVSQPSSTHAPKAYQQSLRDKVVAESFEHSITSQGGIAASRRSSISSNIHRGAHVTTPLHTSQKLRNVITTPSKDHQSVAGESAIGLRFDRGQHSPFTSNFTPGTPQHLNGQLIHGSETPQQLLKSQQQMFERWFLGKAIEQAQARVETLQATNLDVALLSNDRNVRSLAMQQYFRATMNSEQGSIMKKEFSEAVRLSRARKQLNTAEVDFPTQFQSSPTLQSPIYNVQNLSGPHHGILSMEVMQKGSPQIRATPNKQYDARAETPSPRRSPRLQKSRLAHPSPSGQSPVRMINPMRQTPALFQQNPAKALNAIELMRRTTDPQMSTPRLPQKPIPNDFWTSPADRLNLFQGTMPIFPQPAPNTLLSQPINGGYEYIDDDIEITGAAYNPNSQSSGGFANQINGRSQSYGHQASNIAGLHDVSHHGLQNGHSGRNNPAHLGNNGTKLSLRVCIPKLTLTGTQIRLPSEQPGLNRPQPRATPHPPSQSQTQASARGPTQTNLPKDIPDGGHRGVVCKNCHHEWWNTWCDEERHDTCYNCWKNGVSCERPQCADENCKSIRCKNAHEDNNFTNTFAMDSKRPKLKRKNKKADDHDEPPRKKMKEQGGDLEWDAWSG